MALRRLDFRGFTGNRKELRDAHILGVVLNTAEESAGYNSYYSGNAYGTPPNGAKK